MLPRWLHIARAVAKSECDKRSGVGKYSYEYPAKFCDYSRYLKLESRVPRVLRYSTGVQTRQVLVHYLVPYRTLLTSLSTSTHINHILSMFHTYC